MTNFPNTPRPEQERGPRQRTAPRATARPRTRPAWLGDLVLRVLCQAAALLVLTVAVLLAAVLVWKSWLAMQTIGAGFLVGTTWNPAGRVFGAFPFVWGTLTTSAIAMLLAVPLGVGTAVYLAEIAPPWLRRAGSFFVEMLAAIPSVVYGFWGLYVLAPAFDAVTVALGGPHQHGLGILPAGLVLSVMILPYVAAVSFEVIRAVPQTQREAALALGATRWQTVRRVVLPYARGGILGGSFLALGRALGETMAVTMLIGNSTAIRLSPFAYGNSIASAIATQFTEASSDLYLSALTELGLVLLLVNVAVNALARMLIGRTSRPKAWRPLPGLFGSARRRGAGQPETTAGADGAAARGRIPRGTPRTAAWVNRLMTGGHSGATTAGMATLAGLAVIATLVALCVPDPGLRQGLLLGTAAVGTLVALGTVGALGLCLVLVVVPLFLIFGFLLYRGGSALSWDFFAHLPAPAGEKGGGLAHAIYGSFLLVSLATLFAVPVGLFAAIYLAEYRSDRLGPTVRFVGELLGGVPSIVIGVFAYAVLVVPMGHFSGWAGSFALGVIMIPVVMRAAEEALRLVPPPLREASYALGGSRWQTVLRVNLPAALPAVITAIFLGIARVAGETAPVMLTALNNQYWPRSPDDPVPSLPYYIYHYALSSYGEEVRLAWAAAFVLLVLVLFLNFGVRMLAGKRLLQPGRGA